jgi:hypothetical protein
MKATVLGCTLKRSPAQSNSELLADTDHGKEWSKTTAATCANNLYDVALALKERPIPPE